MGAVVHDVVAGGAQVLDQRDLELVAGVVGGDVDAHGPILPYRPPRGRRAFAISGLPTRVDRGRVGGDPYAVAMTRSGIDLTALDPDVRPQDDLYAHVNGRWVASHEIPADRAMDGSFRALHDQAEEQVRDIIVDAGAAAADGTSTDPVEAKVGAVYA